MKIEHGLMEGQVLQRNKQGKGEAHLQGKCSKSGSIDWRVIKGGKVLPGKDWKECGEASSRQWHAAICNLSSGGPYTIEFRIRSKKKALETVKVDEVFVGDVWILAGQSNMQGMGNMEDALAPHPKVRSFCMRDEWSLAEDPLNFMAEAVDVFHNGYGNGANRPSAKKLKREKESMLKGVGPGLSFGKEMFRRTRVPQGLITCAHGGTTMDQWSPSLRDQGGASLYGAIMRRYEKLGQPVAGVIWYQGESDANPDASKLYTQKMIDLVSSTRRDMGLPQLPWSIVQLGRHANIGDPKCWNSIQDQQRSLIEKVPHLDVAPAIDLELDDAIHISGVAQIFLGRRLARITDRLVFKTPKAKPSLRLKSISFAKNPTDDRGSVMILSYSNVVGKLKSNGLPTGFTLFDAKGKMLGSTFFKISLKGNKVLLYSRYHRHSEIDINDALISYGHGRDSYCNITDEDGMAIPAMDKVPISSWNL